MNRYTFTPLDFKLMEIIGYISAVFIGIVWEIIGSDDIPTAPVLAYLSTTTKIVSYYAGLND